MAAGMIAVSACGPLQLGAAAIYGGQQRITQTRLAAEVADLNAGYQAGKAKLTFQYTPADMPRRVLSWMLTFAAMDQLAARQPKNKPITVTPAEVQNVNSGLASQAKQNGLTLDEAAVEAALPPDLLPAYERFAVIQGQVSKQLGNPSTAAGQAAAQAKFNLMICRAAKSLNIAVNPQYGAFSYQKFEVLATASSLTAPSGRSALSPATAPEFKPSC